MNNSLAKISPLLHILRLCENQSSNPGSHTLFLEYFLWVVVPRVAHPWAVPWGAFKIKAVCQKQPVFVLWSPTCKPGTWWLLSASGYAGWDPSAGLELLAWLHSCPGFSLMCSDSFPAATPPLARHTCKSPLLSSLLSKTSQRTSHHLPLITLKGKQGGRRELEMEGPLVSLQSLLPCCCGSDCACVVWRDSQKYWLFTSGVFLFLCWANITWGWRSPESSEFTFHNHHIIFPCSLLAEHFH